MDSRPAPTLMGNIDHNDDDKELESASVIDLKVAKVQKLWLGEMRGEKYSNTSRNTAALKGLDRKGLEMLLGELAKLVHFDPILIKLRTYQIQHCTNMGQESNQSFTRKSHKTNLLAMINLDQPNDKISKLTSIKIQARQSSNWIQLRQIITSLKNP